ncbi:MAG: HAD hydrolase family protein [Kiritimatiellae bacterium]|nr:HAD hydrolase family protein [Kiritimatiellia bacterium]
MIVSPENWSAIKLLVLDFDGVMTDNRVLVDQDGRETVLCHRGDGFGITQLKKKGVLIIVLSAEPNPVVSARCRKLGVQCFQDQQDKIGTLKQFAEEHHLGPDQIAYVGNDLNDIPCLEWVKFSVAVADAMPAVLGKARHVTSKMGGYGAVREVCDWVLNPDHL